MKEEKTATQLKCESYADKVIAFMPEDSKNKLLRSFIAALFVVRISRAEARRKDFEGWTSEFAGAHDVLVVIAEQAGLSLDYKEDGKDCLELEFVMEEGEGGDVNL